jgi:hypothetical protein
LWYPLEYVTFLLYCDVPVTDRALTDEGRRKLEEAVGNRDLTVGQAADLLAVRRETFSRWLTGQRVKPKHRAALKQEFGLADTDFVADVTRLPDHTALRAEIHSSLEVLVERLRVIEGRLDALEPPDEPRSRQANDRS